MYKLLVVKIFFKRWTYIYEDKTMCMKLLGTKVIVWNFYERLQNNYSQILIFWSYLFIIIIAYNFW